MDANAQIVGRGWVGSNLTVERKCGGCVVRIVSEAHGAKYVFMRLFLAVFLTCVSHSSNALTLLFDGACLPRCFLFGVYVYHVSGVYVEWNDSRHVGKSEWPRGLPSAANRFGGQRGEKGFGGMLM